MLTVCLKKSTGGRLKSNFMPPLARPGQNWNNVLSYIKLNLGAPLNLIEMSDDEIVENLKEHTLQTFSQYCPLKKWVYIGPEHAVNTTGAPGKPQYVFKIPKPDDEPIVDILEVIFGPYSVKCIQCAG